MNDKSNEEMKLNTGDNNNPRVRKQKPKSSRWIVGAFIVAVLLIGLSLVKLEDQALFFLTPLEAKQQASELVNKKINVAGMVKSGSVQWAPENLDLKFVITDMKGVEISVDHVGTPPDLFKEDSGVVLEGKLNADGTHFVADRLMVKHSEEYAAPDGSHSIDKKLLEQSLFGDSKKSY